MTKDMIRRLAPLLGLVLAACATTAPPPASVPPHVAVSPPAPASVAGKGFVAAANPMAVDAGERVLKAGGSAVDAAVAIQAVLALVEPQSTSLTGGAFMTYFDGKTHKVLAYNGRETAPKGATPDMFLGPDGKPMPFIQAVMSGRSTGAPGAVAMLALAQKEHGKLAWKDLFGDAERLARDGFVVPGRMGRFANSDYPTAHAPDMNAYFTAPDGSRIKPGVTWKNVAYADTVHRLAAEGPSALYSGEIAAAIAARTHDEPIPGTLTAADIAAYKPIESDALCRPYRAYTVCLPPPPSSGVALLQALMMLEHTDIDKRGPADPEAWSEFIQASRLMYADRDRYVGDPDFVSVPIQGMLDPAYVAKRAALITPIAGPWPQAGNPRGAGVRAVDATHEPGGTSHFIVVDKDGNVVSMTTTVEGVFGSGRMTHGMILNNQLTDFSFLPKDADGAPAANAAAALKRPRSTMTPVIILDRQGNFVGAVGSPGGSQIIDYDLKALIGMLDWNLPVQQAMDLPNIVARGGRISGEFDKLAPGVVEGLKARGLQIGAPTGEASGLHGVMIRSGRFDGGADSRREGVARTVD